MKKDPPLHERTSGVLLHPTSLPGGHGIGDLGRESRDFVDRLSEAGQMWWQMLPLNPPGYGNSPYNAQSAFAGNPLLLNLEDFVEKGWLTNDDVSSFSGVPLDHVHFTRVKEFKESCFRKAFNNFRLSYSSDFEEYCDRNSFWLEDYSLFSTIKSMHRDKVWTEWDEPLRKRNTLALLAFKAKNHDATLFHKFLQFQFEKQWNRFKNYATSKNVYFIGDIPIFVAHDSADVWAHPALFKLNRKGMPTSQAGVPPDYFSETGQLWGNPLYQWKMLKQTQYKWWSARIKRVMEHFDVGRLDHFIGFHRTWEVPGSSKTAQKGRWRRGPGETFFRELERELGPLNFIAEDLGLLTSGAVRLRKKLGFPGMTVLQFLFWGEVDEIQKRIKRISKNCVIYTGTHDNETIEGWLSSLVHQGDMEKIQRVLFQKEKPCHWDMIRLAFSTRANMAVVPFQDILGLGRNARMNRPGTRSGNWTWRVTEEEFKSDWPAKLYELTKKSSRAR